MKLGLGFHLIIAASLMLSSAAFSAPAADGVARALDHTQDWQQTAQSIQENTGVQTGYNLRFRVLEVHPGGGESTPLTTRPESYSSARYVVSLNPPSTLPPGSRIVRDVQFGYTGKEGLFRKMGALSYVVLGKNGEVLEIGSGTKNLEEEFKSNLNRKTLSPEQVDRVEKINRDLFDYLKSNPEGRARVAAFAKERNWPAGYAEKAGLVFFSATLTPLEPWAKQHGYSLEDLRDAGWMEKSFDRYGRVIYSPTQSNSIKIPFFADEDGKRIVRFRSRLLYQTDPLTLKAKYRPSAKDRALDDDAAVSQRFYNSELLPNSEAKTIVITEGEFKAFIATQSSGITTVGLTGIYDYDAAIIKQLVQAKAKKYVVIFDADPIKASNTTMGDGITDTQRTAFQLAKTLERAGAQNVTVGTLPAKNGKVGLDDMILDNGVTHGAEEFKKVIDQAVSPDEYARRLGMNSQLEELTLRRQALSRAIKAYEKSPLVSRSVIEPHLQQAQADLRELDPVYNQFVPPEPVKPEDSAPVPVDVDGKPLPPIHPSKANQWEIAKKTPVESALQISLRPTIFGRGKEPLADIAYLLPKKFPNLELKGIQKGINVSILDLPELSLENARKLSLLLQGLSAEELRSAHLLDPVTILDPKHIEIDSHLRDGIYRIGIVPDPTFQRWRERLIDLIARHDSTLGDSIKTAIRNNGSPLIELMDWAGLDGTPLSPEGLEKAEQTLKESIAKMSAERPYEPIVFSWTDQPLDLASRQVHSSKAVQISYRANAVGTIEPSKVSRWSSTYLNQRGVPQQQTVEFYTTPFLSGDSRPTLLEKPQTASVESAASINSRLDFDQFTKNVSPGLKALIENEKSRVPNASLPSLFTDENGVQIFHRTRTQGSFAPEKAVPIAPLIDKLNIPSNGKIFGGYAVYGSSTHRDMNFPVDVDLLYNGIIHVPDSVQTQEEAVAYARKVYLKDILGHFAQLARQKKIAISELRIGSYQTMNQSKNKISPADNFKDQPYLTQEDFLKGYYTDSKGKVWSLEDLVALDDFSKIKFDYFENVGGKTVAQKFSLQFLPAFEWHQQVQFMRSAALKGFANAPVSTAAYFGADSYAAGMILDRPMSQNAAQYGPIEVMSIRELLAKGWNHHGGPVGYLSSDPQISTKFLKEFHRKITFYQLQDPALEAAIFEETKRYMQRAGTWDSSINAQDVSSAILHTINSSDLDVLNRLKTAANDFAEFNERNQAMSQSSWIDRKNELLGEGPEKPGLFDQVREAIRSGRIKPNQEFISALKQVESIVRSARSSKQIVEAGLPSSEKVNGKAFTQLEEAIPELQNEIHTLPVYKDALSKPFVDYIKTSIALSPHITSRFARARFQLSDSELALRYRLLGIDPTPENIARMKHIDDVLDTASPDEIKKLQLEVLAPSSECAGGIAHVLTEILER